MSVDWMNPQSRIKIPLNVVYVDELCLHRPFLVSQPSVHSLRLVFQLLSSEGTHILEAAIVRWMGSEVFHKSATSQQFLMVAIEMTWNGFLIHNCPSSSKNKLNGSTESWDKQRHLRAHTSPKYWLNLEISAWFYWLYKKTLK